MAKGKLAVWTFDGGYVSSVPRTLMQNILAWGSFNGILTGLGFVRNFGGLDKILTHGLGSWQFFQTDNSFAGLGDETGRGKGSVFKVQRVLAYTGEGAVRFGGDDLSVDADSTLQYLKKVSGAYVGAGGGLGFPASQARPSAPTIVPKDTPGAGHAGMDGSVSVVIWRIDEVTGQVSLASIASNVLVLAGQSVIVPFPTVDTAQTHWGIGVSKLGLGTAPVFYELKTELGGEVAETTLAYQRTVAQASIANGTNALQLNAGTPLGDRFTAADEGRRVFILGKLDSWITDIVDAFNANTNDDATATATDEALTVTHAVDGILRSVEISWTSESLFGQDFAPDLAYPAPSNLKWAGILEDTMFVETDEGIIYVGVPGFIGSFPPKQTLFPSEPATLYLDGSDGLYWRFSKSTFMALTYSGGTTSPLDLQQIWKNVGILFPQNAAIGIGGRVIAWTGKPVRLGAGQDPDTGFADAVLKDFEGWEAQTADMPVVCASDPDNLLDIWMWNTKIMALRVPSDKWCSPIDVSAYMGVGEYIISAVIVDNKLRIGTNAGSALNLFYFDEGTGGTLVIRTGDAESLGQSDTITEVDTVIHVDDTDEVTIKAIVNFDDDAPVTVGVVNPSLLPTNQNINKPTNIVGAKQVAIQVEMESTGKNCGVQTITAYGETNNIAVWQ